MLIKNLGPSLGVEIIGLNLKKDIDKNIIGQVSDLLSQFSVVVIRDQNITNDQHIHFSEYFGDLEVTKAGTNGSGSKLIILRNFDEDGNIVPATDRKRLNNLANQEWHSDSSFKKIPSKLSILSAKMIPEKGGNTEFLSMRAVYNSLPEKLKSNFEDKVCWHDYSYGRSKIDANLVTADEKKALPPVKLRNSVDQEFRWTNRVFRPRFLGEHIPWLQKLRNYGHTLLKLPSLLLRQVRFCQGRC